MTALGTVYSFPDFQSGNLYVRPTTPMAIGDACPTTLRALLSRSPGRVNEMFITLTENCFEVMMFRKWEPRLQSALNTGLIIADMTVAEYDGVQQGEGAPRRAFLYSDSVPCREELMSNAGSSLLNEELMVWPARSKDTMMYQVREPSDCSHRSRIVRWRRGHARPRL